MKVKLDSAINASIRIKLPKARIKDIGIVQENFFKRPMVHLSMPTVAPICIASRVHVVKLDIKIRTKFLEV